MAWYPLVSSWMQEAYSSAESTTDGYLALQALIETILISRFRSCNLHFYDTDVADCRDKILDRLDRRLAEPMKFKVKLAPVIEGRTAVLSLASAAPHAALVFDLAGEPVRCGYIVRLISADRQMWRGEYSVEHCDAQRRTLAVQVPGRCLRHGQSYSLELTTSDGAPVATLEFHVVRLEALHLLRADRYSIVGSHSELHRAEKYRAVFRDAGSGAGVADFANLMCSEVGELPVDMAYDQLAHEQDVRLDVSPHEAGHSLSYFACVRAVRHETLQSRRGFVARMARNTAQEYASRKVSEESLEGVPAAEASVRRSQDAVGVATLLAKSVVERLPERTRSMLLDHEIEGRSWAEIAKTHGISEAKAKQDVSRALTKVSQVVLAGEDEAARGAVQRVVEWIKGALVDLVAFRHSEGGKSDAP